jgi:hypothetical protein
VDRHPAGGRGCVLVDLLAAGALAMSGAVIDWMLAVVAAHPEPFIVVAVVLVVAGKMWRKLGKGRRRAIVAFVAGFAAGRATAKPKPAPPGPPQPKLEKPTTLYRYYDAQQRLLYVGITCRGAKRAAEHAKTQPWWPRQVWMRSEHFDTWAEAEEAERVAIKAEKPECNEQRWEPRRGRRAS